jgi:peptidoglycan hydrolase FlgJ
VIQAIQGADFLQSLLKSTRMGEHFSQNPSPLRGAEGEVFDEMLESKYAANMVEKSNADLLSTMTQPIPASSAAENKVAPIPDILSLEISEQKGGSSTVAVDDFIKSIWPKAKQAAALLGLDPKILMAQAALETGWGKFIAKDGAGVSSNNLFNIKAASNSEEAVNIKTTEYVADTPIKINASFKKYPSVEQSFNDYVALIKGTARYQEALAHAASPENYVNELHKAGYATDPEYGAKILSIYYGHELERCAL